MTHARTRAQAHTKAQAKSCPVCSRPPARRYAPFCSKRCSDVDLGRWLNEGYAIPILPADDPDARPAKAGGEAGEDSGEDEDGA